jgi:hypothetical protein
MNIEEKKLVKKLYDAEKYKKNIEKIKIRKLEYNKNHKKEIKIYNQKYIQTHKEEKRIYDKKYNKNLTNEIKDRKKKYNNNKIKTDINYKISCRLRTRLCVSIKNNQKVGSAVKDLGCSIPELKLYLESKFQEGMSWDNWKHDGWHIDHIIPLSSFNLQNRGEFLKANHYTNLQPMWAEENLYKGSKNDKQEREKT